MEVAQVPPRRILALTFTNKAATEMFERVEAIIGPRANGMIISTFHSLCAKFLQFEYRNYYQSSTRFAILDGIDQVDVLKHIYRHRQISAATLPYHGMLEYISHHKITGLAPTGSSPAAAESVSQLKDAIYQDYQHALKAAHALDFDDLMLKTREILTSAPAILQKWQAKFDYFLIDEFQDTSKLQYEIIALLAKNRNLTIVGDPDQTIYSWRGADISFINNFDQLYPEATTVVLHQNYRSTQRILSAANRLIRHNPHRLAKELDTTNEPGSEIEYFSGKSQEAETAWVIAKINRLKKSKVQLKDIAILYRSNFYSRLIEDALITEAIPHKIIGGQKFYERAEIKDALSFLRAIWAPNDIILKRIINIPARKIGEATLARLVKFAARHDLALWDSWLQKFNQITTISAESKRNLYDFINTLLKHKSFLEKKLPIHQVLESCLTEIGYLDLLQQNQSGDNGTSRLDNVKELFKSIKTWEEQNAGKTVDEYLDEIALINLNNDGTTNLNYVSLMTIHAAKGLEFKNVFVIGLNEEIFPTLRAIESEHTAQAWKLEEERRLAYVAITRARERLFLSGSRGPQFNGKTAKQPSRFLAEMGIDIESFINLTAPAALEAMTTREDRNFSPGTKVMHTNFGEGIVLDIHGDTLIIEFKNQNVGIKQLLKNHKAIERL